MKQLNLVVGSVVLLRIQKMLLRYFSLLPAAAATAAALPSLEATAAATGRPDRATAAPTASTLAVATRVWTTTLVLVGTLSVVSRNNKSWRSWDLIFKIEF